LVHSRAIANSGPLCGLVVIVHDFSFWFHGFALDVHGLFVVLLLVLVLHLLIMIFFYGLPIFVHVFLHCVDLASVDHGFLSYLPVVIHDLTGVDHGFLSYLPMVIRDLANVDYDFLLSSCIC
jgi:hypothetical protein